MAGRPSKYTKRLGDEIAQRLAEGESLRSICRDEHIPAKSTVLLWVVDGEHEAFSDQYRRAREAAGYSHGDEVRDIAEELRNGKLEPQTAKVMLDALKWSAERMAPKSHSPRQEITGADGGPINLTDTEREQRIAALLERARARRDGSPADGEDMGAATGAADTSAGE